MQLKKKPVTNIQHSTSISTFDALSKWHDGHLSQIIWILFWYKIKLCIGDEYCDDIANTLACDYDGGDCCAEDANTDYCVICDCIINDGTGKKL